MQISNLLLLAFGAGVLANPILPSNEHNNEITDSSFNGTLEERSLEKRGTYGWVGVYATPDCSGDWDDTPEDGRPKIHGDCIKFSMEHGQYLGVSCSILPRDKIPVTNGMFYDRSTGAAAN